MAIAEVIRGDNYAEDFVCKTVLPTDVGYDAWTGTWAILDKLETTTLPFASGALVAVTDPNLRLTLRIPPADTLNLKAGTTYKLVVQVSNATLGFNREVAQKSFKILSQGI